MFGYGKADRELDEALHNSLNSAQLARVRVECIDRAIASGVCGTDQDIVRTAKVLEDYILGRDAPNPS